MTKTFLVCSLAGRLEGLIKLIDSLHKYADDWNIIIVMQKYPPEEKAIIELHTDSIFKNNKFYFTDQMTGPHIARSVALSENISDVWCILDDDMWAIENTRYDAMADIVFEHKNIGLLSGNWRKTQTQAESVDVKDKLLYQTIVYTGGGMMFRQDVADVILSIPKAMYVFDNPLWSIYAFVNGYDNCRYMGSVAVHNICTKGGRIKWLKECDTHKRLPPSEWIRTRAGKGKKGSNDEFLICDSSDVTELAKELHERNKK